jgi:alcohol dehydrogenase
MRAVVYDEYGATPVVADLPEPACPDDGVLVRVGATGVCRSDWHAWIGHDPVPLPMVPGHEYAGTIAAVGAQVARWKVGDRVTVPFACGCGRCAQCATGDTHVCPDQTQPSFTGWGSFAELVAVHAADTNVVALPDELGFVDAASLGCRFATAYRAVVTSARVEAGEWVAVHGCGGVGLSAVMIAAARGAHVVAVDVSARALAAAGELGATTIDATGLGAEAVAAEVRRITGLGAHASIDALGSVPTMQASVLGLRPRGRHVQVGLMLAENAVPPVPMGRVVSLELEVIGAHGMPARDYDEMLALVVNGALPVDRLVGRTIALDEAPAALVAMSSPASSSGITVVDLS